MIKLFIIGVGCFFAAVIFFGIVVHMLRHNLRKWINKHSLMFQTLGASDEQSFIKHSWIAYLLAAGSIVIIYFWIIIIILFVYIGNMI